MYEEYVSWRFFLRFLPSFAAPVAAGAFTAFTAFSFFGAAAALAASVCEATGCDIIISRE
jgi:uncharacterized protein (DUF2062 family)